MGGYNDIPENRAKLEAMTREKWDKLALEPQYRWILFGKRMIADGCPDYLNQIGVDDTKRSQIIGAYNQRRQDSHARKRLI